MKAMAYYGAGDIRFEEKPKPQIIDPTDAVVKIVKTTICGTDLGIWKGKNPEIAAGRILGHEGIGVVEEVGSAVKNIKKGDKVIISCVSKCCTCDNCKVQLYSHCRNGGWILGYMIDGTQAEYVRTPYADNSLILLPDNVNEEVALLLSDALPTAHEIGVQYGDVKPGDTVFIAGAGPVGMSALLTAQLYSPSVLIMCDMDENRLKLAKDLGATHTINPASGDLGYVPRHRQARRQCGGSGCARCAGGFQTGKTVDQKPHHHDRLGECQHHRNADEGDFHQLS